MSCSSCFSGAIHTGNPTGSTTTLHGLPVYVALPRDGSTPKGVVVMIPDAFGWDFVNNRLLCDAYAEKGGWLVYLPDFMGGHSAPVSFVDLMEKKIKAPAPWLTTLFVKPFYILKALSMALPWLYYNRQATCKPRIFNFFTALRKEMPETKSGKLGAAGFCWGGFYIFQLIRGASSPSAPSERSPLLDAAYTAHPSMLSLPSDITAVGSTVPLQVVIGDQDHAISIDKVREMQDILMSKNKREGSQHEVIVLEGAKHGFAIRLDPEDEVQNRCAAKAEELALGWFSQWLV